MKLALASAVCATFLLAPISARAADEKARCLAASSQGQTLRDAHQLLDAREQFRICARRECPGLVAQDCGAWLDSLEKSLPTIVLSAKDPAGRDLFDVSVSVDGKPFATRLDGHAVPLDPGAHVFRFELAGGTSATQQVLVREGDKMRDVTVILQPSAKPAAMPQLLPAVVPPPGPLESHPGTAQRVVGIIVAAVGVVGLGVGTGLGVAAKSADTSAASETGYARYNDSGSAVGQANVATAVFIGGAVAAAAGVVVWITAPTAKVVVGVAGHGLVLQGRF